MIARLAPAATALRIAGGVLTIIGAYLPWATFVLNDGAYPEKSTLTLPQLVYNLGFQRFDIGAACVIAIVLFVLSMTFAALLMRKGSVFLGSHE